MVQTHKTYGLLTALAMIIVGVIMHITNVAYTTKWASWVSYIPFLIGIILNANAFSKANGANITFGQAFSSGFKACAIIALLLIVWSLLSVYVVFPDMKERSIQMAIDQMNEQPGMTDEQIDAAVSMTKKFYLPFLIGGAVFGTMFFGAIFSLIGAAIAKKNPVQQQGQPS